MYWKLERNVMFGDGSGGVQTRCGAMQSTIARIAATVLMISTLAACGDELATADGPGVEPTTTVVDKEGWERVIDDPRAFIPVYSGTAEYGAVDNPTYSDPSERLANVKEQFELWTMIVAAEQQAGPKTYEESVAELAESTGVDVETQKEYLAQAKKMMEENGIEWPSDALFDKTRSGIYTEAATICGDFAVLSIFPLHENKPGYLQNAQGATEMIQVANGDADMWVTPGPIEGMQVVSWVSTEQPILSLSVFCSSECDPQEVYSSIRLEEVA